MVKQQVTTLGDLALAIEADLKGDNSVVIGGIASLSLAGPEQISFIASPKHAHELEHTKAAAVAMKPDMAQDFSGNALLVADPYLAYAKLSKIFDPRTRRTPGIHPTAVVAESATISSSAAIGAHCVISEGVSVGAGCEIYPGVVICENSTIGDDCIIYSNVSIYPNVRIGSQVIVHSGTTLGSDGFGFAPSSEGWVKIHQLGGVVIGDRVDIGSGVTIDRGALEDTVIHDGVIIDNQVHIAHNVEVGENTALAGCVGIAGSTKIGKNCTFGGQVGVVGHIEIADNCHFNGGTIVTKGTKESGAFGSATPMLDVRTWRRTSVRYSQLDELAGRIKKLEKLQKS